MQFKNTINFSNDRLDYETDEAFANFREVNVGSIHKGILYRSSSPIDNTYNRALYSNSLAQRVNTKSVVNLEDTLDIIDLRINSRGFRSKYYQTLQEEGNVVGLNMTSEFNTEKFKRDITQGVACIVRHRLSPPVLVHCLDGKTKTGYVIAVIEALMGASYEDIVKDYMLSYSNYSNTKNANQSYNLVVDKTINDMLFSICKVSKIEDLKKVNLSRAAREFLESHGMNGWEIDQLMSLLSTDLNKVYGN